MAWKLLTRFGEKVGTLGTVLAAMGCAACFPTAASIGAAMGLGFLSRWEPILVRFVLPLFAASTFLAAVLSWRYHHSKRHLLLGSLGPMLVLMGWFGFFTELFAKEAARDLVYGGLLVMVAVSIWSSFSPPDQRCPACEPPSTQR